MACCGRPVPPVPAQPECGRKLRPLWGAFLWGARPPYRRQDWAEIAHTMCARRPGGTRKARQRRAFQSVDKVNFFENTVFRASSAHEIDFAVQNHKNREHGPGHPLLPLCGNSPCVSRFLYLKREKVSAWELSDVCVLRSQNTECRKNVSFSTGSRHAKGVPFFVGL